MKGINLSDLYKIAFLSSKYILYNNWNISLDQHNFNLNISLFNYIKIKFMEYILKLVNCSIKIDFYFWSNIKKIILIPNFYYVE